MTAILANLLMLAEEYGASDIHIVAGMAPRLRIRGSLVEKGDLRAFDSRTVDAIAMELGLETLPPGSHEGEEKVRMLLARQGSLDGALTVPGGARFRFNVFREMGRHAIALRRLDSEFRTFEELGLPAGIERFCEGHGLFIVCGPTGSGKSTTLAAMVNSINARRAGRIITIEQPVEFLHPSQRCLVSQREVGKDVASFDSGLRDALRQDPDVILVGECRDIETARTALRAAETGHLVYTTLHSGSVPDAIERIVAMYPPDEQSGARRQLSLLLRGILVQHLVGEEERRPACELLVNTTAAANLIATARSAHLYSVIETGAASGMVSLDQSLVSLVAGGVVSPRGALALSHTPELLEKRLAQIAPQTGGTWR